MPGIRFAAAPTKPYNAAETAPSPLPEIPHRRRGSQGAVLPNCDVHHTTKNPQFLKDCCRLKLVFLNDAGSGPDLNSRLKPPSKIVLDVIRGDVTDRPLTKRLLEVQGRALVCLVGLLCPNRRLGIVLQKKVRPILEL